MRINFDSVYDSYMVFNYQTNMEKEGKREEMDERIAEIADHYGFEEQKWQCIEEMAELILAICKYRRAGESAVKEFENLKEEVADVRIMIEQLRYLLGPADIDAVVDAKLDR